MTEVSEVLPSLHDRARRSQRDCEVAALAEEIFVRLVTQPGNPLVRPADQLVDAAAGALRAARVFYQASDEWFSTQAAAAAAEAGVCDDRR